MHLPQQLCLPPPLTSCLLGTLAFALRSSRQLGKEADKRRTKPGAGLTDSLGGRARKTECARRWPASSAANGHVCLRSKLCTDAAHPPSWVMQLFCLHHFLDSTSTTSPNSSRSVNLKSARSSPADPFQSNCLPGSFVPTPLMVIDHRIDSSGLKVEACQAYISFNLTFVLLPYPVRSYFYLTQITAIDTLGAASVLCLPRAFPRERPQSPAGLGLGA